MCRILTWIRITMNKERSFKKGEKLILAKVPVEDTGDGEATDKMCITVQTREELRKMMGNSESMESTQLALPKHILDIWAIVLIILGTIVIMTLLVLCPATTVIIYRVWTHPMHHNGAE